MLRTVSAPALAPSTENNRKKLRPTQEVASGPFGRACKGLWGDEAPFELAKRTRKSLRVAEYKIAGRVKPSGVDVAVIVDEITRPFR